MSNDFGTNNQGAILTKDENQDENNFISQTTVKKN